VKPTVIRNLEPLVKLYWLCIALL